MEEKRMLLMHELQNLKTMERRKVALEIDEARQKGDLLENDEYIAAIEKRAEIEARIATLETMLRNYDIDNFYASNNIKKM